MKNLFENAKGYEKYVYYKEYNKNALIFLEGEKCTNVCIVVKGEVSIVTSNYDSLVEINNLKENELFGDSLVLIEYNRYL